MLFRPVLIDAASQNSVSAQNVDFGQCKMLSRSSEHVTSHSFSHGTEKCFLVVRLVCRMAHPRTGRNIAAGAASPCEINCIFRPLCVTVFAPPSVRVGAGTGL